MSAKPSSPSSQPLHLLKSARFQWLLDGLAVLAWGIVLLKFWLTQQINILLHPDYVWLAYSAGFFLLGVGALKLGRPLWHRLKRMGKLGKRSSSPKPHDFTPVQHLSFFPPAFSSGLLLLVALFGLFYTPQPFASQVAIDRGVTETLTMTRSQPQAFRGNSRPENRSLIDWVRTLNVYPEPDAYTGQKVNVDGFVIHPPELDKSYLLLARFVITCCAADAYPVGFPVKLLRGDRSLYQPDRWLKIQGSMVTETLQGKRQLVIQADTLQEIPKPTNPYDS